METPSVLVFRLLCIGLILADLCEASSFKPNCTLPTNSTNYHLNVPAFHQPTTCKTLWIDIPAVFTKVKWMVLTIFFPEYLVGKALAELAAAIYSYSAMKKIKSMDNKKWGLVHCYLANMGHFVLDTEPMTTSSTNTISSENQEEEDHTVKSGESTQALTAASNKINACRLQHRYWALNCQQWHYLFKLGVADTPTIPSAHLEKLDKGGSLVKFLAICQVGYLAVQLISRKIQGLPSSQIEIGTLALSVSSIITYLLYVGHPHGVETIHIIPMKDGGMDKIDIHEVARSGPCYLWRKGRKASDFIPELGPSPIPNDGSHRASEQPLPISDFLFWTLGTLGTFYGGIPFGGLHCLAWNSPFPTRAELIIWRVCSVATTCLPVLLASCISVIWNPLPRAGNTNATSSFQSSVEVETIDFGDDRGILFIFILIPLFLYLLARSLILFEMIRSLFFLPPQAFIDTSSNAFPHWG
ncbi:hypothetical protein F5Y02DRAFT_409839 [Annulohypoxylon stygium]|nr:hypothetical protein F5Y02DRAFT_409839 [Annulohypoxylon stygium]